MFSLLHKKLGPGAMPGIFFFSMSTFVPPLAAAALILYQMLHGEKCLDSIHNTAASLFAGCDVAAVESLPRFRLVVCCLPLSKQVFILFS